MTRLGGLVIGMVMFAAACGGSEKSAHELCEASMRAYCDKVFDCAEGESRRADEGGTKAACVTNNITICPSPTGDPCPGTTSPNYHQDKAEQCVAQAQALTCTEFGVNSDVAVCEEVCTP